MAAPLLNSGISDLVRDGMVVPVHCQGREILRRIFVTVRDRHWQEVPATECHTTVDAQGRTVALNARHTSAEVDFEWHGTLQASQDHRTLRFAFEGRALRDMQVCRLGLVILHPLESLNGAELTARGPEGEQRLLVNRTIHPQPIVNGMPVGMTDPFSELTIERADFGRLVLKFKGDLFEMEDQRNWGDASFKTYCTPLRLGFPRTVKAGTVIAHSVDVEFTPAAETLEPPPPRGAARPLSVPAPRTAATVPTIGREWREFWRGSALPRNGPNWHHIHVNIVGREGAALQALEHLPSHAKFELGIQAADPQTLPSELLVWLHKHKDRIARLQLYGPGLALPAAAAAARWHALFNTWGAAPIPLVAATRGYFVEFNRGGSLDPAFSGVAFPLSATVHADDPETITDNVVTIRDMAATIRQAAPHRLIVIAPLALYYPPQATPKTFPAEVLIPWLSQTLEHAAVAGVTSITLAEDVLQAFDDSSGQASPALRNLLSLSAVSPNAQDV